MTMGLEECIYIWYYTYVYGVIYQYVRGVINRRYRILSWEFGIVGRLLLMSYMSVFRY